MKTILIVLCAAVLVTGSCSKSTDPQPVASLGTELMVNTSVESGTAAPDKWFPVTTNPLGTVYTSEWSTSQAHSGTHSLKISAEGTNGPNYLFWTQTVPFDFATMSGKRLWLSFTVKTEKVVASAGNYGVGIFLNVFDVNNNLVESANSPVQIGNIQGNTEWTSFTVSSKNPLAFDTQAISVVLALGPTSTGAVYFDDISLKMK